MTGFQNLNIELDRVSKEIETTSYEVDIAREEYLIKKAEYENKFAEVQLRAKAEDSESTQTDIKAMATRETYELRLEVITKDSACRKALNKLRALRDRLEAMREVSFNLRRESKI